MELVDSRDNVDFEISGEADSQKAGTAKKLIMWDWRSNEQASIQVINLRTKEVVFAYSVNKPSSAHGRRSSAEACAKHLKEKIETKPDPGAKTEPTGYGSRRLFGLDGR